MPKKDLIQEYIKGWIEGNASKINDVLNEDCIVIESHGPTYIGKSIILKWFKEWTKENSVKKWEITSYYEVDNSAFFEWEFNCIFEGKDYFIEGISLINFDNGKISFIREYRTTNPRYRWM